MAMRTKQQATRRHRQVGRSHDQAGFTLAEVLLSIVVFTVSVVGVVSMQRATYASQENAMQTRSAQRIAQEELEEMMASGFNQFVAVDLFGLVTPSFPYDDRQAARMFPYRGAPVDVDWNALSPTDPIPPGLRMNHYRVVRRVDSVPSGIDPSGDPTAIDAISLQVWVLWTDHNPSFPPPAGVTAATLLPENTDPTDAAYLPYARGIHLSTIIANDGVNDIPPTP